MQADDSQPRLGPWSHAWRLLAMVAISGVGWYDLATWQWNHDRGWLLIDVAIGLICFVLVTRRRRHPRAVALLTNALATVSGSASGPAVLSIVSLATRRRWREILPVSVVAVVGGLVLEAINPGSTDPWQVSFPIVLGAVAIAVGWGMYIGSRRELLTTLRDRAVIAETEQAARVAQARTAERSRIAREMHDVLAHRISLVTMHAGALTYRDDLTPDQMRETAEVIQDNSHQALVELREVLGILREDPGDAAPERPQPSAYDLPSLVEEARHAGMNVSTEHGVPLDLIPEAVGRTVYRIVQEGLTNARKHAPDTRVTLNLSGHPGGVLEIEIRNPLRVGSPVHAGAGLGLVGLTERTGLAGGQLEHSITSAQEFRMVARLPWPA